MNTQPATGFYSNQVLSAQDRKDPKKVGAMFESMFYRMIFKEMRASSEDPLFGGSGMDQWKEIRDDEMAQVLGMQGKLGIADMITESIEAENKRKGLIKE